MLDCIFLSIGAAQLILYLLAPTGFGAQCQPGTGSQCLAQLKGTFDFRCLHGLRGSLGPAVSRCD